MLADDFQHLPLGVKELWSLWRDPIMLVLILFVFTVSIYTSANSKPETLHNPQSSMRMNRPCRSGSSPLPIRRNSRCPG
ncbi:hypothetical protein [Sphingobium yanoikuyae]|uniref:hypothetical protein n=1 Tax=Sphingobium yanoikuyae TaxID=13690 RepID=UPI003F690E01